MSTQKTLLKAIGLIRLSTQEQAVEGKAGIDRQKNDIQVAARVHGLEVTRVVEVIESGTKVRGQADFQQIFRELKNGATDGVVCSNLDRLVRPDCFEDFAVFDHFRANRKKIWTPGEAVDPSTQGGFLMSGFRGLLAGLERQLIVARTTSGKEALRKRGWHPNGDQLLPRGVGFERIMEDKKVKSVRWLYEEPDATRVRRAFQLLLEGQSYRAIAEAIGGGWTGQGIRGAMLNTIWYGVRTFPPTADRKLPLERRVIEESEALVTRETWETAREIILGRKKAWGARKRTPRFLAAGLLKCSICGKPYYMRANARRDTTRQQEHYYCSSGFKGHGPRCGARSLQRVAVDRVVTDKVKQRFRDPEFLLWLVGQSGRQTEARTDTAKLERELGKIAAQRERVEDAWQEGSISKESFQKRTKALDQQARELRILLPAKAPALDARRTVKAVAEFFAGFEDQSFADQRQVLRTAFKEFIVDNNTITGLTLNVGAVVGAKVSPDSRWPYSRRSRAPARAPPPT
jgi:DNA invertase Pin-like site-specific DNA recombinase